VVRLRAQSLAAPPEHAVDAWRVDVAPGGAEQLDKRVDAAQDALLAPLSPKERRELRRLLSRLVEPR